MIQIYLDCWWSVEVIVKKKKTITCPEEGFQGSLCHHYGLLQKDRKPSTWQLPCDQRRPIAQKWHGPLRTGFSVVLCWWPQCFVRSPFHVLPRHLNEEQSLNYNLIHWLTALQNHQTCGQMEGEIKEAKDGESKEARNKKKSKEENKDV